VQRAGTSDSGQVALGRAQGFWQRAAHIGMREVCMRLHRSLPLTVAFVALFLASCASARTVLTYNTLMTGTYPATVNFGAYLPDAGATAPTNTFEGTLHISGTPSSTTIVANATYVTQANVASAKTLPTDFNYQFVQSGNAIIPVQRGPIPSSHAWWEFILEPGQVWNESGDNGYTRAAIPFSLQQKNANCTHNGVLMLLFRNDGTVSRTAMQITSETCLYLQLNLWGLLSTTYTPGSVAGKAAAIAAYNAEVANRLPTRSTSQLATDFPGVQPANLAIGASAGRTLYGLTVDGINYVSACATRNGDYPYCDVMDLPSFSTAKSAFAAIALMRLEMLAAGSQGKLVSNYVSQCATSPWSGVTFRNVLDMATGDYDSSAYEADENSSKTNGLFVPLDHASKISYSCGAYARKATPGTTWVYHTSDTYVLGTAMNAYLKTLPGHGGADVFADLVVSDIYGPLGLSPVTHVTRRTYDSVAQPFTGWGLTLHRDDTARIANFLSVGNGTINGVQMLDPGLLDAALQRTASDRGLATATLAGYRYQHGFWARDVKSVLGCVNPTWVPFMSGFGGISVVMFPNGVVYYNFADDGLNATFDWSNPAKEANKLGNFCQ